jgi:hypothetical protein
MKSKYAKVATLAATLITFGSLAGGADAAITLHLVQEGGDVRLSFSGSIDLTGAGAAPASEGGWDSVSRLRANGAYITDSVTGDSYFANVGNDDVATNFTEVTSASPTNGSFGFNNGFITWEARHVTGGVVGGLVTELTAAPSLDTVLFTGQTLASLNASGLTEGQTLWTANGSSDTIQFSALAPVPEPSSALLLGLGALVVIGRRHRIK